MRGFWRRWMRGGYRSFRVVGCGYVDRLPWADWQESSVARGSLFPIPSKPPHPHGIMTKHLAECWTLDLADIDTLMLSFRSAKDLTVQCSYMTFTCICYTPSPFPILQIGNPVLHFARILAPLRSPLGDHVLHLPPVIRLHGALQLLLVQPLEVLEAERAVLEIRLAGHYARLEEEGLGALLLQAGGQRFGRAVG
jgi:hypothetical protein